MEDEPPLLEGELPELPLFEDELLLEDEVLLLEDEPLFEPLLDFPDALELELLPWFWSAVVLLLEPPLAPCRVPAVWVELVLCDG